MNLRIGSLFSGAGMLDEAVRTVLGGEIAWHVEVKPAAVTLLQHRYPDVPNHGDITALDPSDVEPVDALTFGWPCQPHSAAGKRLGSKDPRALWPEVHRLAAALRPQVLCGENVARVVSNGELRRVVRSLAEIGYVGAWRCVRAADVGAPHRRDRLFLLAYRTDGPPANALGPLLRDEPGRSCRTCGPGPGVVGDDGPERAAGLTLLPSPTARLGASGSVTPAVAAARASRRSNGPNLDDAIALLPTPAVADARNTRNATAGRTPENDRHHSGWTLSDVAYADRWGRYANAILRWEHALGRQAPPATMPNPRTGQQQLSPALVEFMMGWPQGWVTDVPGLTRAQQLSLLGDGVVPQQAAYAYSLLVDDLRDRAAGEAVA